MALKIVEGAIGEMSPPTPLASEAGPTGASWSFVQFDRGDRPALRLERVTADSVIGARIALNQTGRFAFYSFDKQMVLCGFLGPDGIELAGAERDPAVLAAEAIRLPAKRKIFWGILLIPTIIGLFFAFDIIRAGRATLRAHPAPSRPGDKRLIRALKGQWRLFW